PEFGTAGGRVTLGGLLIALGTVLAVGSMQRWAAADEAIRQNLPIPATRLPIVLGVGVISVTVVPAALLFTDWWDASNRFTIPACSRSGPTWPGIAPPCRSW